MCNVCATVMLPDKEIWTAANMLMQRYGDIAAEEHAFNQGQELRNAGDMDGYHVWRAILGRIIQVNLGRTTARRQ